MTKIVQSYLETVSGAHLDVLQPKAEDIHLEDIATALSNICRFTGHVSKFYSVAEHCVLVSLLAPEEHRLAALMHDVGEMLINDIASPVKKHCAILKEIENIFLAEAGKKFGFTTPLHESVHAADMKALYIEAAQLKVSGGMDWGRPEGIELPNIRLACYPPHMARHVFLQAFYALTQREQYRDDEPPEAA